ncbi:Fur family transcriptional regulator [Streptomyces stelliscabiei]|uniref:Fur family transcriptional regulator n=1 Tax=Streptomyces stelliscabiei TaxID=146820 RepID=UPI0029B73F83|nr:transcriptional repressor [Streptomyces stelliscabiei]MDX2661098.1 transcriptional repressor [Streptomyces stelliscabiei]MDX2715965.1 transcriptional repressor [Streptomyces stelliscabiei]MDX2790075.1 transcriptional repressor [Streptomyces stelliscabiei]
MRDDREGPRLDRGASTRLDSRVLLRRQGLRCTPGRLRILALLSASARHLSIAEACEELAQSGEAIHTTTVYRTLESLTAIGLTHAVHGRGPTRYGFTGEPHHHTVCQGCGHVAALAIEHLTEAESRIQELTGLRPDSSGSLLVFGRCALCSADG